MMNRIASRVLSVSLLLPATASAHHAMGGATPLTWWQGFASGLAHPVIGPDHLAFLLAAGLVAAVLPVAAGFGAMALFVAAGVLGAMLHVAGLGLGPVEAVIAGSILAAGGALLLRRLPIGLALAGFAVAGLFHGHAFAESIIGSERAPLLAYLLGLAIVQSGLLASVMLAARRLAGARERRLAGLLAACFGAVFLVATLA